MKEQCQKSLLVFRKSHSNHFVFFKIVEVNNLGNEVLQYLAF